MVASISMTSVILYMVAVIAVVLAIAFATDRFLARYDFGDE